MANLNSGRMTWTPLAPFGAAVDFDLNDKITDEETRCFVNLFDTYDLLIFRGQRVKLERHVELVNLFGPVANTSESIGYLTNDDSKVVGNALGLDFHSDYAWAPSPLNALSLHATDVVDNASATSFVSAVRAYERLPAAMKTRLVGVDAIMVAPLYDKTDTAGLDIDPSAFAVQERRRAVTQCDRTGRPYLLVTRLQTIGLFDMAPSESESLLRDLFGQLYSADNQYEHLWRNGDFLIWNNRTLQHARSNMKYVGRRILQRVGAGISLEEQYPELAKSYEEGTPVES
jgi:taurine dioxygenase